MFLNKLPRAWLEPNPTVSLAAYRGQAQQAVLGLQLGRPPYGSHVTMPLADSGALSEEMPP